MLLFPLSTSAVSKDGNIVEQTEVSEETIDVKSPLSNDTSEKAIDLVDSSAIVSIHINESESNDEDSTLFVDETDKSSSVNNFEKTVDSNNHIENVAGNDVSNLKDGKRADQLGNLNGTVSSDDEIDGLASISTTSEPTYVMANDDDFRGEANGEFRYIGTDEYVEIPHVIKGVPVTSYNRMFSDEEGASTSTVKGVKSTNTNITSMNSMFYGSQATELDLGKLNTSSVVNMSSMFNGSQAVEIKGLENFITSNVTTMSVMFQNSRATSLDLSSFDTSNVTNMRYMFGGSIGSQATTIKGLDKFNTSKVTDMRNMFANSQATSLNLSSFDTSKVTE